MKIDKEGNVLVNWEYEFKVKDLQLKLYKLKDKLLSVGMTWEEQDKCVKRHKKYSKQLKNLKQRGHI